MLFALLWQSLALARPGSTVNALVDAEHAALHWQEEGHHHHDDGSYHQDDSAESVQHALGDSLGSALALLTATAPGFARLAAPAPPGLHPGRVPDPTSDGLLRPLRARS
ncbi:MAG: hypothetical protein KBC73_13755 [Burkholderiaceae bacterium]|nr:hypothetical protein [Burkholderiaceae bacterium]